MIFEQGFITGMFDVPCLQREDRGLRTETEGPSLFFGG
jgi:hypothetical protein